MRISTSTLYDSNILDIQNQQQAMFQTQQQLATGKRILTPKDDPVAAAQAVELTITGADNTQYEANITSAKSLLNLQNTALDSVVAVLENAQQLARQAAGGTLSAADRATIASQLDQAARSLVDLANSPNGTGGYLFGGTRASLPPYARSATGTVTYQGDQGQQQVEVAPGWKMAVTTAGSKLFDAVPEGTGAFNAAAASGNTGSATVTATSVANASDPGIGTPIEIKFNNPPSSYQVINLNTGQPIIDPNNPAMVPPTPSSNYTYTSGQPITFDGKSVTLAGTPAAGDGFTVTPVGHQSMFATLSGLATALRATDTSGLPQALANGQINLANALDQVLTQQSGVGANLNSLNSLTTSDQSLGTQYATTLSSLQDVDFAKAASQLSQEQLTLQAAQQSFAKIQGLSLFSYING